MICGNFMQCLFSGCLFAVFLEWVWSTHGCIDQPVRDCCKIPLRRISPFRLFHCETPINTRMLVQGDEKRVYELIVRHFLACCHRDAQVGPSAWFQNTLILPLCLSASCWRESEREFIGANIKQFHAKIKLMRWDTEKICKTGCLVGRPSTVS